MIKSKFKKYRTIFLLSTSRYNNLIFTVEEGIYFFLDVENISVIFIIREYTRLKVCKEA